MGGHALAQPVAGMAGIAVACTAVYGLHSGMTYYSDLKVCFDLKLSCVALPTQP
jgi:hypothetical protein